MKCLIDGGWMKVGPICRECPLAGKRRPPNDSSSNQEVQALSNEYWDRNQVVTHGQTQMGCPKDPHQQVSWVKHSFFPQLTGSHRQNPASDHPEETPLLQSSKSDDLLTFFDFLINFHIQRFHRLLYQKRRIFVLVHWKKTRNFHIVLLTRIFLSKTHSSDVSLRHRIVLYENVRYEEIKAWTWVSRKKRGYSSNLTIIEFEMSLLRYHFWHYRFYHHLLSLPWFHLPLTFAKVNPIDFFNPQPLQGIIHQIFHPQPLQGIIYQTIYPLPLQGIIYQTFRLFVISLCRGG